MHNIVKLSEVTCAVPNQQEIGEYIASMSFELSAMAARAEMPFLTRLLDMSIEEARHLSRMPRRRRTDTK